MTRTIPWPRRGPMWLFVPADRPDRLARAVAAADHAVVDLEDAVDPAARPAARAGLRAALAGPGTDSVVVRINALDGPDAAADLAAVREAGVRAIMVPKAEDPEALRDGMLDGLDLVVLCETARGIRHAETLAASPAVVAVMWGSVDLAADLGCRSEDPVLLRARHDVLYAARATGRLAIDRVCPDLDDAVVAVDAKAAAACGYDAKAIVHPRHGPLVATAFAPDREELAWAERTLATARGAGAQRIGDTFVDAAVLQRAQRIAARRCPPPGESSP